MKPIIVLDFDGVIHSYKNGWKGVTVIPDEPVEGVKEFIKKIREKFLVYILSSRTNTEEGKKAVENWLKKYNIEVDKVVEKKPPAYITIDDRCICFDGKFEGLEEKIYNFFPYWY